MLDAVACDVDGVLIEAFPAHVETYNGAFELLGYRQASVEEFRKYWSLPGRTMVQHIMGKPRIDEDVLKVVERKRILYKEMGTEYIDILPGAVELIEVLYERKVPVVLVSAGSRSSIDIALDKMGATDKIRAIISIEDVTHGDIINGKPHPEGYIMAAELLGTYNCIAFEDSAEGVQSAKGARLRKVAAVATGMTSKREELMELEPDFLFDNLTYAIPRIDEILAL